jgi:hypothetical protein
VDSGSQLTSLVRSEKKLQSQRVLVVCPLSCAKLQSQFHRLTGRYWAYYPRVQPAQTARKTAQMKRTRLSCISSCCGGVRMPGNAAHATVVRSTATFYVRTSVRHRAPHGTTTTLRTDSCIRDSLRTLCVILNCKRMPARYSGGPV